MAGLKVEESEEHGDKHAAFVVGTGQGVVDAGADVGRFHALLGQRLEQAGGLGHEQRCGDALAADVAQGEVELAASKQIAVEVAADFSGGNH